MIYSKAICKKTHCVKKIKKKKKTKKMPKQNQTTMPMFGMLKITWDWIRNEITHSIPCLIDNGIGYVISLSILSHI